MNFTQDDLKKLVHYDPETGEFTRLKHQRYDCGVGSVNENGYLMISIRNKCYRAHRLAWFYMTGEVPDLIDHINRDKLDNRWNNLRKSCKRQNAINTDIPANNTSGCKGVSKHHTGKWRAYITEHGKQISLGLYALKSDAIKARQAYE